VSGDTRQTSIVLNGRVLPDLFLEMPKKSSFTSTLASMGRLLPKRKKHSGEPRRHRSRHDDSLSSSGASSEKVSFSNMSEGRDERYDRSPSRSDDDIRRLDKLNSRGNHQKGTSRRGQRSDNDSQYLNRERNRGRRSEFYSPNYERDYTPPRHRNTVVDDDAARSVDLLMRILPLYGRGDSRSDALVLDTIDRLPSRALETKDIDGNTLLLIACQTGAYNLLPTLLEKGCSINARNNLGASCLHYACSVETFAPDVAMTLLRHGALAEVADLQFLSTPLHWAAYSGHIELCMELCRSGAIPTTVDRNGFDSIHYSCFCVVLF
jgi:ankyrin repeat protein